MSENLKYFIGKICTIITVAISHKFKEEIIFDYSVGLIEKIDDVGILMSHIKTNCKTYIFLQHIVSISEEQVLYEKNPEHKKIIDEYRAIKPETAERTSINQKFFNPAAMAKLAQESLNRGST